MTTAHTTALEPVLRPLPLRMPILDGESVDSWLEELARRHRLTLRALLPALGITATTPSTIRLIYGIDPPVWRHVEQVTGLPTGRLDAAVGDPIAEVSRLRSGGSRYCPRCLADTDGSWQLSWRLNWTVACLRHRLLLRDRCPRCAATPRVKIAGGRTPIPPASCTHAPKADRQRCGMDLTSAAIIPANDEILAVQHWIECLIDDLRQPTGHPNRQQAADMFADLPTVVCWLLLRNHGVVFPAARRINPDRPPDRDAERRSWTSIDAALTAAALHHAKTLLDGTDRAAIATLRRLLAGQFTAVGVPPRGMATARWQALRTQFPNRYLRAADPDLAATQRLRTRSVTEHARHPDTEATGRVRQIPQMLWPDWTARLLPVAGFHPELFRATLAVCLLIPGRTDRELAGLPIHLNPRITPSQISVLLQEFADLPGDALTGVLTVLCRIADHLDHAGSPIDYQRRRERIPTETINWPQWHDLACSVGAHPGDHVPTGRHLHAQRHLHHLITGADLADPQHPLTFRHRSDRSRYLDFTTALTPPLRQALHEHATILLTGLGITEPLTWSPPGSLADGLDLPGIDPDTLDMTTISRIVVDQHRPVGDAAQALNVHREHIRLALERLDRPQRQWATKQYAAGLFTRDYLEREYLRNGRSLHQLAEDTGIGRHIIARFAKQHGIPLAHGRIPFPVDPGWLREQYCHRRRSTADIAAELGTDQMIINHALHRLGIPARPSGVASHPQMITKLDKKVPRDIRAAVEGTLHGWLRLHRFQISMAFPNLGSAAAYLGTHQRVLTVQFQRLERDIGAPLYHRAAFHKPHGPTPRGQTLLRDLAHEHIQQLITAGLRDHQRRPLPDEATRATAHHQFLTKPWTPPPRTPVPHPTSPRKRTGGAVAYQLRISRPVLTVLRDVIDHPGQFYGLEIHQRTGIDEGTLYPILHRMHNAGWLTSHPEDEASWLVGAPPGRGPGRRRTYYTLTPAGYRAALHELHNPKPRTRTR